MQTIDTVPTDGTPVFLWWGEGCAPIGRWERCPEGDEVTPAGERWGKHLLDEMHHIANGGWLIYPDDPQPTHWASVPS